MSQFAKWKWTVAGLLVAVLAFAMTSLRFASNDPADNEELPLADVSAATDKPIDDPPIADTLTEPAAAPERESERCLTLEQLESHPVITRDAHRFDAVSDSGPVIAAYRGLSEQEIQDLAAQGDSAAMVVLGAMSVMRARAWPVEKAVAYLLFEDPELRAFTLSRPLSTEFLDHMKLARQWFYKAALHGRVMVLYRVGDSLALEKGGPVELGWISRQEYDGLSDHEKTALHPFSVYNVLAYEVAPGLKSGPPGQILTALIPRTEQQMAIVDELAGQFARDLHDAGLPPVVVPESSVPPADDLLSLLCESERDRLEKILGTGR